MKLKFGLFILLSILSRVLMAQDTYKNPILPGFYPDPSICRVGDDYYLVTSSFGYFPGVPIFHSKDLIHWQQIGHVLSRKEQLPLEDPKGARVSGGIFAPTIRYHNELFYMISTNMTVLKNFFVTAKNPEGPWSDPTWIELPGMTIDPSLFFDDDGKTYLTTSPLFGVSGGIRLAEINLKTGKLITPMKSLWDGAGGRYPEGPHLYKKDNWYYLLIAEGGTEYGHKVTIARSKHIDGPYLANPANPILTHINRNAENNPIQGVGHADLIETDKGSWWMVALGFRPHGSHHILGRETFLTPVEWQKNEWPIIGNNGGTLSLEVETKTLPLHTFPEQSTKDDFNSATLSFIWNYISNPKADHYSLNDRPGYLRLSGNKSTISQGEHITFVGRRQQHHNFSATTSLEFEPQNDNEEAGLSVFMDFKSHYELSIKNINGKRMLQLSYTLGMINHIETQTKLKQGPITLKVEGFSKSTQFDSTSFYTFSFSQQGKPYEVLGKVDSKFLSSETAGGFTGVYLGLFASGNGKMSLTNADFDWFSYQEQ